jgi:uncharacterized protein YfiM (DUF2279 family)
MFQNQRRLLLVFLYMVLIFAVSSIPSLTAPGPNFVPKDKIAHTVEYFVLGVLLFRGFGRSVGPSRIATFGLLFAIGAAVAAADELYQSFIPGRLMSIQDWFADALGLAAGIGIFAFGGKSRSSGPGEDAGGRDANRASDGNPT